MKRLLCTLAALALPALSLAAPASFTGSYAQDFDGLPQTGSVTLTGRGPHDIQGQLGTTGADGWAFANFTGSSTNAEYRAQNGSLSGSTGRGAVSFGLDGSSERAYGALPTSNQIATIGAVFTNDTPDLLTSLRIQFTGEQWRRGNVTSQNTLGFAYGYGSTLSDATTTFPALDFSSVNSQASPTEVAIDGNDPANRATIIATISGLNWAPGADFAIGWTINDVSGQDDAIAIDDVRIVPEPTAGLGMLVVLAGALGLRRR